MESGATDRDRELREQIPIMPWERFEQLIFELVARTGEKVIRLKAPDGGADVLRRATEDRPAKVWQAKRYGDQINWEECEISLAASAAAWKPAEIVFAFARDFSKQVVQSFEKRLVAPGRTLGIAVTPWTLSEIVRRLDDGNDDLKVRFFGREQESVMEALDRTIKAGGKLEAGADLLDRARSLTDYSEAADPDFTYSTTTGPATSTAPTWDQLPYMTLVVGDERTRVEVSSWTRAGADVETPSYSFTDGEAGTRARDDAVRALAVGEEAVLTEGVHLRFHAPELFKEMLPGNGGWEGGQVRLQPGDPLSAGLAIRSEEGDVEAEVELRPVPARPGGAAAYAGYLGRGLIEINFVLLEEPNVRANVTIGGTFGSDAREDRELARLVITFITHTEMTITSSELFPGSGRLTGKFQEGAVDEELLDGLRGRRAFYEDLVEIEEATGEPLPVPDEFMPEDVGATQTAARVLRDGGGTATFERTSGIVANPRDVPSLPSQFRAMGSTDRMVSYEIFGQQVDLGVGRYELPELKIVEVIPQGDRPDAPARVVLEAADDDQMQFKLIDHADPGSKEDGQG